MPEYAVDLHLHSALSPCSSDDMTPNNIVNMALLKGLDIIAVTDHNAADNVPSVIRAGRRSGLLVVAGMEVETREEVHVLCLFPESEGASKIQNRVQGALPDMKNREDIFGRQLVMDEEDRITRIEDRFLITAASIGLEELVNEVALAGGVSIPAHVDRQSFSVISNLGGIPEGLVFPWLEISRNCDLQSFLREHPELSGHRFLRSSDAHSLGDILEREYFLELEEKSAESLLKALSV